MDTDSQVADVKAPVDGSHQSSELDPAAAVTESMPVWSAKEERMVRLKLDLFLMPLLIIGFFVLQLDRSNISNALTNTIKEDLNVTKAQVGTGNQIMSAGIVVAEIPANLLLQRFGAPVWITFILSAWGTVSITQAFVKNKSQFYATRFLLGLFEGGYIPGAQYILALFYKSDELAMRTSVFYFGNYFSAATGSLIAAGILKMSGQHGLAGWQWLFIIEGAVTLAAFVLFFVFIPFSPTRTRPIHGLFDVFSAREREVMQARVVHDDASKQHARMHITWADFVDAVRDYRLWLHGALNVAALSPKGGLQLYAPSIIKSLGFGQTRANLLNSVSSYLVVVLSLIISFASDRTGRRGIFCIISFLWAITFGAALLGVDAHGSKWLKYALFTLLGSGNALAQALNDAWININARTACKRSIGLAFVVMGSNIGGIIGPQLFKGSNHDGFVDVLALYATSIVITLVIMFVYWRDNKIIAKRRAEGRAAADDEDRYYEL